MHHSFAVVVIAFGADAKVGITETADIAFGERSVKDNGILCIVQAWMKASAGNVDVLVGNGGALEGSRLLRTAAAWLQRIAVPTRSNIVKMIRWGGYFFFPIFKISSLFGSSAN